MTDQHTPESTEVNPVHKEGRFRGRREHDSRELGGFRIRLSDNEMKAARAVQEAFGLRSTIAALGFAIRTTGQMLLDGKLDDLVLQQRIQSENPVNRYKQTQENAKVRQDKSITRLERRSRPDPFARPSRPNLKNETDSIKKQLENDMEQLPLAMSISKEIIDIQEINVVEQNYDTGI